MKPFLESILRCPSCLSRMETRVFVREADQVVEGLLVCKCGLCYPIWKTIPRLMLPDSILLFPEFYEKYRADIGEICETPQVPPNLREDRLKRRTRESFGYQWTRFPDMVEQNRDLFLRVYSSVSEEFYRGKLGLDAGCGFGRHLYYSASLGARMVGLDYSAAIDVAREIVKGFPEVYLVQGDIYHPPFANETFDFVYSFGVLHHLPDPEKGFKSLIQKVKRDKPIFIWVYSKKRKFLNFVMERMRAVSKLMPLPLIRLTSLCLAIVDYYLLIAPYKFANKTIGLDKVFPALGQGRLSLYSRLPFKITRADWFDRLSPPLRFYYNQQDLKAWVNNSHLGNARITPTGRFGWRLYGERKI